MVFETESVFLTFAMQVTARIFIAAKILVIFYVDVCLILSLSFEYSLLYSSFFSVVFLCSTCFGHAYGSGIQTSFEITSLHITLSHLLALTES